MDLIDINKTQDDIYNIALDIENYYYKEQDPSTIKVVQDKIDKINEFLEKTIQTNKTSKFENKEIKYKLIKEINDMKKEFETNSKKIYLVQNCLLDIEQNIELIKKI